MSHGTLPYQNPSVTNSNLDVEDLTVNSVAVKRERVQLTGRAETDIAPVTADDGLLVNLSKNALDTYEACFAVVAAGSGDAVEFVGSASKTCRVLEVYVSEPSVARLFQFVKRSSAAIGGLPSNPAGTPLDSTNAAATLVINNFASAPTAGSLVGSPLFRKTLATSQHINKSWVDGGGQVITLRGVAETFCINVNGAVNFDCYVRWTEAGA